MSNFKIMESLNEHTDVILIGAGIMSATLGIFLKELDPSMTIEIYERLDVLAGESSDAWNNAGTGHSAFCELNYTPQSDDGTIDITKAIKIAESFAISRQLWSYLVQNKSISSPESFINSISHMSFVWGAENVHYLKKRWEALTKNILFEGMIFSDKKHELEQWIPLVMEGRDPGTEVAATRMDAGTDVNFGALTRAMIHYLQSLEGVKLHVNHEVRNLEKEENDQWKINVHDLVADEKKYVNAKFVFIGAGGGSLPLLEKSDIKEAEGYGGFPVSGQWLKCNNQQVIERHQAKVYGKASVGSPPMSVPHLDTRMINGKKALLFGPYAGFSTKFLKHGSFWDLAKSIELENIGPMLSAGAHNLPLTKYLIQQASQSDQDRFEALKEYFPEAKIDEWELVIAGQRVQVIKKDKKEGGVLEFGTEIVHSEDGTLAALLGASPGASVSASVMLNVLGQCFKDRMQSADWQNKLKQMIPSYGQSLATNPELYHHIKEWTRQTLHLNVGKK